MNFNDHWKEKSTKRKKSWTTKAKRFAEQHAQLEAIRKEVYMPLDYKLGFNFDDYKLGHYIKMNPIAEWQQTGFGFSEENLRNALKSEGAALNSFKMETNRQSIKGKTVVLPKNRWEQFNYIPNKVFDYESVYHAWLKRIYEICTDVETVVLTYEQITMTIKRYSTEGVPFGYYELNPCEQLTKSAMLLQETDFYTLNIATLLMEMAAEWELRQDELNYFAKKLKLRTIEAVTVDDIEFDLWDEKKLRKKIPEYIAKGYVLDKIIKQVVQPWKLAIKKYVDAAVERSQRDDNVMTFEWFATRTINHDSFVDDIFRPYLESLGLWEVEMEYATRYKNDVSLKYQGMQCRLLANYDNISFYPNASYKGCFLELAENTPLSAFADCLKLLPAANRKMDETLMKVLHIYNQQMQSPSNQPTTHPIH